MLYSFSQASYSDTELARYFQHIDENDAVLLWQNGVLLALKYAPLLRQCRAPIYVLNSDVQARGLCDKINADWCIEASQLPQLCEKFTPQFAV